MCMRVGECMRGMSVKGHEERMQVGFLVVLQRLETNGGTRC